LVGLLRFQAEGGSMTQPRRDEEELVEEIGWQFCIFCKHFDIEMGRCSQEHWKDRICDALRDTAEDAIIYISQAIAEGRADEPKQDSKEGS